MKHFIKKSRRLKAMTRTGLRLHSSAAQAQPGVVYVRLCGFPWPVCLQGSNWATVESTSPIMVSIFVQFVYRC
jgi:hypothetical protein